MTIDIFWVRCYIVFDKFFVFHEDASILEGRYRNEFSEESF
jgi:hypothetical protein